MVESGFIEVENARLHVEDGGSGDPVLLLHGLGFDQRSWDEQVGPLRERHRVVRLDLHGFGCSSPVSGPYSHTKILQQLLLRLGIERAHVVGHSMGGRIAAELVQTTPAAVRSLTLVCTDVTGLPFSTLGPAFAKIFETGRAGDVDGAKQRFLDLECFDSLRRRPDLFARVRAMMDTYSGWVFAHAHENPELRPARKTAEVLGEFDLPTLSIVGALDAPDFREIAEEVAKRVPGARRCVMAGAGHCPNLEAPAPFNQARRELLGGA
jgi:3-oxoadipate enol-lactonase